ncbi:MAG: TetR/AcrR family transcriptional regulator [Candidatus Thermoplasmatota archaeon]|nr:TetR/AcrR family transcriptional regulator [Candidatus Thermoplasmatota archaeon]
MARKARARPAKPTRERILDAALECFAENGFSGSSTKEIARRAKVNEVTVFRLFKSKRALFLAVLGERSPVLSIKDRVGLEATGPLEDLLANNIRTVLGMLRSNRQIYFVVMADAWRQPKMRNIAYEEIVKKGIEFVALFMKGLMDAGKIRRMDPEVAARGLMGAVQFYFLTTEILGGGTPRPDEEERFIRGFVSIFMNGMKAEQEADELV